MNLLLTLLWLLVSITETAHRIQTREVLQPFTEQYQQIKFSRGYYDNALPVLLRSIRQFSPRKTQIEMLNLFKDINIHPIDLNIFKELQTRYRPEIAYLILSSRGLIDYLAFDIVKPTGNIQDRPQWVTTQHLYRQCYWHLYFTYLYEIILTEQQIIPSFDELFNSQGILIHDNIKSLFDAHFIPWTRSNIEEFRADLFAKMKILSTQRTFDGEGYTKYKYNSMINDVLSPWRNFEEAASEYFIPGQKQLFMRCHERYLTDLLQHVAFEDIDTSLRDENKMKIVYIALNGYFNGRTELFDLLKQRLNGLPEIMRKIRASRFFGESFESEIVTLADETELELAPPPTLLEHVRRLAGGDR